MDSFSKHRSIQIFSCTMKRKGMYYSPSDSNQTERVCSHVHARTRTHAHARTHARTHTHARIRTHARKRKRTHARTHAHACTHTCAHARAHAHALRRPMLSMSMSGVWTCSASAFQPTPLAIARLAHPDDVDSLLVTEPSSLASGSESVHPLAFRDAPRPALDHEKMRTREAFLIF